MSTIEQQRNDLAAFATGIGKAIGGNWSIAGRSVRAAIDDGVVAILAGRSLGAALTLAGVCPKNLVWYEHCHEREPEGIEWCIHGWAAFETDRERSR